MVEVKRFVWWNMFFYFLILGWGCEEVIDFVFNWFYN